MMLSSGGFTQMLSPSIFLNLPYGLVSEGFLDSL